MSPRANERVAALLHELATLMEIEEGSPNAFRVRAYQNGTRAVKGLTRDVAAMSESDLLQVKGIGKAIASKVREAVETGTIAKLEELRRRHPAGQRDLLRIPGLGPKTVTLLHEVLGVSDLVGLQAAIASGRLADLPGLGEKTAENLAKAIERIDIGSDEERRTPIAQALPVAERMADELRQLAVAERVEIAGSLRRFRDTIGDVDILVASTEPTEVMAAFRALSEVADVLGSGDTKTSIVTWDGLQVDLRVVPPESFGAALVYFTGSKAHNIELRQRAIARDLILNEYALAHAEGGDTVAAGTEEEVYRALDLDWVTPEMREGDGEVQLAAEGELPALVSLEDLRGDLHDHTDYSGDGRASMEDMVAAVADRGLEYVAITDHAENLTINGVSRPGMLEQRRRLRELNEHYPDMALLHGSELNIGADGSLDYDREFLLGFDWCVASVHSHFRRDVAEQTTRIIEAMRHPAVNVIGHLLGRRVGKRAGIDVDVDAVLDAAVETGCALEINSNLDRLDAPAEIIREGAKRGVTFVISTDAHAPRELAYHAYGVRQARRGALPKDLVANTWLKARFLEWARAKRSA